MAGVPTEVISAVIGAASGGGVSWVIHWQDVSRQRVQEVRETLLKLLDLREQSAKPDINADLLNQRRIMLLAVADSLAARAGRRLTTPDWLALGEESEADRDFISARRYYEKGLASSRKDDALTQVFALRHMAIYNYGAAPDGVATEGAALFRRAVELTGSSNDAYLRFVTGYSYASWASCARRRDETGWRELADEAFERFHASATEYPPAADEAREFQKWLDRPPGAPPAENPPE
jgi:tetratricopeptide (TPR) repeat protein